MVLFFLTTPSIILSTMDKFNVTKPIHALNVSDRSARPLLVGLAIRGWSGRWRDEAKGWGGRVGVKLNQEFSFKLNHSTHVCVFKPWTYMAAFITMCL